MSSPPRWRLRNAAAGDAEAIAALHRASILRGCVGHYGPAQIRAWLEPLVPEIYPQVMARARMRVALDDDAICGFSTTVMDAERIRAIYVAPFALGAGVGSALLADAEQGLLAAGRNAASLDATRNAVDFFRWHGYIAAGEHARRLPGGAALTCLTMRKQLDG